VDTLPLREFLEEQLPQVDGVISGIEAKVRAGRLRALAISTSSYSTGQSITWIQGDRVEEWTRPQRRGSRAAIGIDHVMASAAIPLFFPAVQVGDEWYGDGGIRLSTPLSPAFHLGAGHILTISTRFSRLAADEDRPMIHGYPPPAQIVGALMNSVFLDNVDQDAWRVEATNRLLRKLSPEDRDGLRVVDLLILRPSRDLGREAREFEAGLPPAFRFLVRGLGTRETKSPDVLSFLLFDPGYIRLLIEMGERDTKARIGEMEGWLGGSGKSDETSPIGESPG
jgi:NTE family protein